MSHYMSDAAICMYYDQAADQKAQIRILAELNACEREEIEDVLHEHGRISQPPRRAPRRHIKKAKKKNTRAWEKEEIQHILQMERDGMSIKDIAEATGRSYSSVNSKLYETRRKEKHERKNGTHAGQ